MITKFNDQWLVSHMHHLLESWIANLDFQLIINEDNTDLKSCTDNPILTSDLGLPLTNCTLGLK